MAERFSSDLFFILFVLIIAALLGFLIGYFLCRRKSRNQNVVEPASLSGKPTPQPTPKPTPKPAEKVEKVMTPLFDAGKAANVLGRKIKQDDLKIVEGIGPKIESIFKKQQIDTWQKLAGSDADKLKALLLKEGGERYRIHDPSTWPKQAKLAWEGKWEELKKYQDTLQGGRT